MRSHRWGPNSPVYLEGVKPCELVEATVLADDGENDVEVRYVDPATAGEQFPRHVIARVAYARLSWRPTAPAPPPGAGGRDVAPLDFGDRDAPGPDHVGPFRWRGWRSGPERKG